MAANGPKSQDRRLLYVAPVVIAVLVVLIGAVSLLYRPAAPPVLPAPLPPKSVDVKPVPNPPALKPTVLTRSDLIAAARNAADEFTSHGRLPTGDDPLVGRRFTLKIPFGCGGVQGGYTPAQMSVLYNAESQSITLTATPGVWTTLPLLQEAVSGSAIEAIEGFWIPRPWTNSDSCPGQTNYPIPATPTPPTGQTLGLAQLFESGGSRVLQHADRPYAYTRKLAGRDIAVLSHSYRLLLEGKIKGFGNGRSLGCWAEAPDHHPLCIYAVVVDHVAFEDTTSGETLANWND